MPGGPHLFFGRLLPFLILSIILKKKKKKKKNCTWEVSIINFSYTIQIRSNWYMDAGVRDLEAVFFKANST